MVITADEGFNPFDPESSDGRDQHMVFMKEVPDRFQYGGKMPGLDCEDQDVRRCYGLAVIAAQGNIAIFLEPL